MEVRAVPLDEEQYLFIEDLGKSFIRAGSQERGTKLLAIALAWKVSPPVLFACEVDESAGVAEDWGHEDCEVCKEARSNVVELHGYSKKAPCA